MYDTALSDYKVTNTPFGRDPMMELRDACDRHGVRLGFYVSLLDWHHPAYRAALRERSGLAWDDYVGFLHGQVEELSTQYGDIAEYWLDGYWPAEWATNREKNWFGPSGDFRLPELYDKIHTLQPDAVIMHNHHSAPQPGEDVQGFEGDLPGENTNEINVTPLTFEAKETCQTTSTIAYGFHKDDHKYRDVRELLTTLVRAAGSGATFLLNVGPTPQGTIPLPAQQNLRAVGDWLRRNGEGIYGTRAGRRAGRRRRRTQLAARTRSPRRSEQTARTTCTCSTATRPPRSSSTCRKGSTPPVSTPPCSPTATRCPRRSSATATRSASPSPPNVAKHSSARSGFAWVRSASPADIDELPRMPEHHRQRNQRWHPISHAATPRSTRRGLLGGAAGLGALAFLAACGAGDGDATAAPEASSPSGTCSGADRTTPRTSASSSAAGKASNGASAKYQNIPWTNWYQTFTSAIAAKTAPAVSSGAAFQPFQFYQQGAIEPADGVVAKLKKAGIYDDFLPGTHRHAQVRRRPMSGSRTTSPSTACGTAPTCWTRRGAAVPTNWDEFRATCQGAQEDRGVRLLDSRAARRRPDTSRCCPWLVNNGGGWFNEQGEPDCVTDRNIEAVEFLQSLVKDGYINPTNVSYTVAAVRAGLRVRAARACSWPGRTATCRASPNVKSAVMRPLTGPHGDKGALQWVDPLMMYKGNSNVSDVEDFVVWFLDAIKPAFADGTYNRLPARKSFEELRRGEEQRLVAGAHQRVGADREVDRLEVTGTLPGARTPSKAHRSPPRSPLRSCRPTLSPQAILQQLQDNYERLHYGK